MLLCVAYKREGNESSGPDAALYTGVNPEELL